MSNACGHLKKSLLVYIQRRRDPSLSLHMKNNDPPRDATPRAGRLTHSSCCLHYFSVGLTKKLLFFSIGRVCFLHRPAVYFFYNLCGDVVMKVTEGEKHCSASMQLFPDRKELTVVLNRVSLAT